MDAACTVRPSEGQRHNMAPHGRDAPPAGAPLFREVMHSSPVHEKGDEDFLVPRARGESEARRAKEAESDDDLRRAIEESHRRMVMTSL